MEKCYVKCKLYLQEAIREIAKEEGWGVNKMAAFAVATKEGLFSVRILIEEDEIKINKINLSESHVVTYNTLYNEDGSIETFADCVSRDVFESGILNRNENFKVSLLLDYKKNPIKTLGGEKIVKVFIDGDNRLNIFTENPIKEVKMDKIGDLPKETIYFGERDGFCSCERRLKGPKDPYADRIWLEEEFFNKILHDEDQIILIKVNNRFQPVKLLKVFELLPDGWHIHMRENNNKSIRQVICEYYLSKQKDDSLDIYINCIRERYKQTNK